MMEPPYRRTEGRSSRASAIAVPGIVLSHAHRPTIASNMWPREMSSIESAMTSRLTSEVFIPCVPIVMPSEIAIVLNSIGLAPAALMPALIGTASSRRPKLQGIVSVQQFDTPMNGLPRSSRVRPIACRKERAGARSTPSYSDREIRSGMSRLQGALEVGHEVLGVLDADREADQPAAHAYALAFLRRDRCVRHAARVLGQRLNGAKRFGEGEDLQVRQHLERGRLAGDLKAHHAAEQAHLPRGHAAVRMRLESLVVHALDGAVALERRRHGHRVRGLPFDAQRERFDAA